MDTNNLAIVRQSFANTLFTHKVQEVAAERQGKKALAVKIINIALVSLTLVCLILQLIYILNPIYSYIGIGLTVSEIIFLIVQLSFSFEEKKLQHKNSALKFLSLRDRYRELITDIMNSNISKAEIRSRRDALQAEYNTICDLAPQTESKDYDKAQIKLNKKGLVSGEEFTWSDQEIDHFLPEDLRLKK